MAVGRLEGGTCVTDELVRENVPVDVIYGNVTELLLAGVDTVRRGHGAGVPGAGGSR